MHSRTGHSQMASLLNGSVCVSLGLYLSEQVVDGLEALGGRNSNTNTKTNTSTRQTQMQTQIKAQIRASGWWVGGAWSRCPGCPGGSCPFVRAHRRLPAQQHHCPHYLFTRCPAPPFGLCCPTRTTWPGEHLEQLGDISPRIDWPPTCPPWGHHLPILQCTSGPKLPLLLSSSDAKLSSWPYVELLSNCTLIID